jgi:hypothetical protein
LRLAEAASASDVHGDSTSSLVWLECRYQETAHFKDFYRNARVAPSPAQDTSILAINIKDQKIAEWEPVLGNLSDWEKMTVGEAAVEWKHEVMASRLESTTVTIDRTSLRYTRRFMSELRLRSRDDVAVIEGRALPKDKAAQKRGQAAVLTATPPPGSSS